MFFMMSKLINKDKTIIHAFREQGFGTKAIRASYTKLQLTW